MITQDQALQRISKLIQRIDVALEAGGPITPSYPDELGVAKATLAATKNFISKLDLKTYKNEVEKISFTTSTYAGNENRTELVNLHGILVSIREEVELGLISSLASQIQAQLFDDFLEHAKAYLADGRKNESGVIAGVTFEDTVRQLATKHSISQVGKKLDALIRELANAKVLNTLEAKRARVSADLRTKATHAQWAEFDESSVREVIEFLSSNLLLKLAT